MCVLLYYYYNTSIVKTDGSTDFCSHRAVPSSCRLEPTNLCYKSVFRLLSSTDELLFSITQPVVFTADTCFTVPDGRVDRAQKCIRQWLHAML